MPLSTYAELKTAIASWLGRSDISDTDISDFVRLFEVEASKRLRVWQMVTSATVLPNGTTGIGVLPTDYLQWRRVRWQGSSKVELEYVHPSYLYRAYDDATGTPKVFTIDQGGIVIRPIDSNNIELVYYKPVPALSTGVNWLYTLHPDAYLFGSLCEAGMFLRDDESAVVWKARRDAAFQEIEMRDAETRTTRTQRSSRAGPEPKQAREANKTGQ